MIALLLLGCGWVDAPGDPLLTAHQGGAAYWTPNSRTALEGAVELGWPSVQLDLFLLGDFTPVLAHEPFLDLDRCTTADGEALAEPVWLYTLTADQLATGWTCGGEPVLTYDEAIAILALAPDMAVHVDARYYENVSHAPDVYAAEILERWWAWEMPNPLVVSSDTEVTVAAFEARGPEVETALSWPYFAPEGSRGVQWLAHEAGAVLGVEDARAAVRRAGADGVGLPGSLAERTAVEALAEDGLAVRIWADADRDLARALTRWPVDEVLTDYPEPAP